MFSGNSYGRGRSGWIVLAALALLVVFFLISLVGSYNRLVALEEKVNNQKSQIDNQLKRRNDLIGNLVETVKGYASHEKEVIKSVSDARAKLAGARTVAEQEAANAELSGALSRLLVVVENYPQLKADATFRQLMDELAGTENRIAVARKDYNDAAREYNTAIRRFPTVLVARLFGFQPVDYFQAKEEEKEAPKVKF